MTLQVQEHYEICIQIIKLNGKENVQTKQQTAGISLHNFWKESKLKKSVEDNTIFFLKTAAARI